MERNEDKNGVKEREREKEIVGNQVPERRNDKGERGKEKAKGAKV